jgi:hypothetical protein
MNSTLYLNLNLCLVLSACFLAEFAKSFGRRPVQWTESFEQRPKGGLDKKTIIQHWKNKVDVETIIADGHQIIYGSGRWYLDHFDVSWFDAYREEPCEYDHFWYTWTKSQGTVRESIAMQSVRNRTRANNPCERCVWILAD